MEKEMEFFIYLMEKYSEYKKESTTEVVNRLEELGLLELIYNLYERYHAEAIENAFQDIDELIKERQDKIN